MSDSHTDAAEEVESGFDAPYDPTRAVIIPEFIRSMSKSYGSREAVVLGDDALTYADLDTRSADIARGLLARGIGKGARIGVLFGNGPLWVTWWAAITRIGAVPVPLSTFARYAELARTIRHADLHAIVLRPTHLHRDYLKDLERAFPDLAESPNDLRLLGAPYLRWIGVVEGEPARWAKSLEWILAEPVTEDLLRGVEIEVHVDDPALTIYTSGSSATPKGVVHSQGAIMTKIHYLRRMLGFDIDSQLVANMPFFWVGGLVMSLLTGMEAGGRVTCLDATTWKSERPLGSPIGDQQSPLPELPLSPALGMTETFGMYSWGREFRVEGSPISAPLDEFEPGYTVELVDSAGKPVADGEIGEIIIRGPTVTRQLVKIDRSETFTVDGFYKTGDRGRREGTRIHFVGRLGDMVKTSGANVAPPEVERELLSLDGIEGAFVTGLDDPERGQEVVAAIVPAAGAVLDTDEIRSLLRERISSYKVPRRIVIVSSTDIPMTPSQKVDRRALADLITSRIGQESDS
jgi:acyl-CoA synthetase (AMP-forming)/AMP-acid ligase II